MRAYSYNIMTVELQSSKNVLRAAKRRKGEGKMQERAGEAHSAFDMVEIL